MVRVARQKRIVLVAAALAAAIALAWALEWWISSAGIDYEVVVRRGDTVIARFDIERLKSLEQSSIVVLGKSETGPSVLTVLDDAGVAEFDSIRVIGPGVRDDGEIFLKSEEVTASVLLDVANRGTVKIVGPDISWDDRVRDVTEIVVEGGK